MLHRTAILGIFGVFVLAATLTPSTAQVSSAGSHSTPFIQCGPQCIEYGLLIDPPTRTGGNDTQPVQPTAAPRTTTRELSIEATSQGTRVER